MVNRATPIYIDVYGPRLSIVNADSRHPHTYTHTLTSVQIRHNVFHRILHNNKKFRRKKRPNNNTSVYAIEHISIELRGTDFTHCCIDIDGCIRIRLECREYCCLGSCTLCAEIYFCYCALSPISVSNAEWERREDEEVKIDDIQIIQFVPLQSTLNELCICWWTSIYRWRQIFYWNVNTDVGRIVATIRLFLLFSLQDGMDRARA